VLTKQAVAVRNEGKRPRNEDSDDFIILDPYLLCYEDKEQEYKRTTK